MVYLRSIRTKKMFMIAKRTNGTIKKATEKVAPLVKSIQFCSYCVVDFAPNFGFSLSLGISIAKNPVATDASVTAQCAIYLCIENFSSLRFAQLFSLSQGNFRGQHLIKSHGTTFAMLGAVRYFRSINRT